VLVRGGPRALLLSLGTATCARPPHLADGPIEVTDRPTVVRFHRPLAADGAVWELCFEFDPPGGSHHGGAAAGGAAVGGGSPCLAPATGPRSPR
jgi:hypothetical protein